MRSRIGTLFIHRYVWAAAMGAVLGALPGEFAFAKPIVAAAPFPADQCMEGSVCSFGGILMLASGNAELTLDVPASGSAVLTSRSLQVADESAVIQFLPNVKQFWQTLSWAEFGSKSSEDLEIRLRGTLDNQASRILADVHMEQEDQMVRVEFRAAHVDPKRYAVRVFLGSDQLDELSELGHPRIEFLGGASPRIGVLVEPGALALQITFAEPTVVRVPGGPTYLADRWEIRAEVPRALPLVITEATVKTRGLKGFSIQDVSISPHSAALDCNANGLPDFGEIASGMVENENGNRTPDPCERLEGDSLPNRELSRGLVVYDGFLNEALPTTTLSLEAGDTREVLRAESSGPTVGLIQYVPQTVDMETLLVTPNFSLSPPGAALTTLQTGIVEGRLCTFSSFSIRNLLTVQGPRLRMEGFFWAVESKSYLIKIFDGPFQVAEEAGLPRGVMWTPVVDIAGEDCRIDDCGNIILTGGTETPTAFTIPGRGTFDGNAWEIWAEGHERFPESQTEIMMVGRHLGPLLIRRETTIPEPAGDDCNENFIPDRTDIYTGRSKDLDQDGVPDECEGPIS